MLTFSRYLVADYERRNFSISQCRWDSGAQQNIITIESPANPGANAKSTPGTHTTALKSGHIAAIIIGSIGSLLFIIFFAFVCKRKLTPHFWTRLLGKPELSVKDKPFLHEDETLNATPPRTISMSSGAHEIDGHMYPGIELEVNRLPKEMSSNEEVGHELAASHSQISELPS